MAVGEFHACAIRNDGSLKCWGDNSYGQLGLGNRSARGDAPNEMGDVLPTVDLGGRRAVSVAASRGNTCVVLEGGALTCFGINDGGRLGLGSSSSDRGGEINQMGANLRLVDLGAGAKVASVGMSEYHTCALLTDGRVKCWGNNTYGQLGFAGGGARGSTPDSMGDNLPAVALGSGRTAKEIAVGSNHTCALLDDKTVKCWGNSSYLGLEGQSHGMGDDLPAVDLASLDVRAVRAGGYHTCAQLLLGATVSLKCWGSNYDGQLASDIVSTRGDQANEMGGNLPAVALANPVWVESGGYNACALDAAGDLRCWGKGAYGVSGHGNGNTTYVPGDPLDLPADVVQLSIGFSSMCALLSDDTLRCWGDGRWGALGRGDTVDIGDNAGEMGAALIPVDLGD